MRIWRILQPIKQWNFVFYWKIKLNKRRRWRMKRMHFEIYWFFIRESIGLKMNKRWRVRTKIKLFCCVVIVSYNAWNTGYVQHGALSSFSTAQHISRCQQKCFNIEFYFLSSHSLIEFASAAIHVRHSIIRFASLHSPLPSDSRRIAFVSIGTSFIKSNQ